MRSSKNLNHPATFISSGAVHMICSLVPPDEHHWSTKRFKQAIVCLVSFEVSVVPNPYVFARKFISKNAFTHALFYMKIPSRCAHYTTNTFNGRQSPRGCQCHSARDTRYSPAKARKEEYQRPRNVMKATPKHPAPRIRRSRV